MCMGLPVSDSSVSCGGSLETVLQVGKRLCQREIIELTVYLLEKRLCQREFIKITLFLLGKRLCLQEFIELTC